MIASVAPGRALDIAAGRGRNSLFLAELGFEVDAVDVSDVAVETVARHAREQHQSEHQHPQVTASYTTHLCPPPAHRCQPS